MNSSPNIFTVDLEEWFVVEALSRMYKRDDWASLHSMVVKNSFRLLEMLDRKDVKATWFVLGWCADKYPDLIQEIFARGHEIGCHSYAHPEIFKLTRDQFRADCDRALQALSAAGVDGVAGYRVISERQESRPLKRRARPHEGPARRGAVIGHDHYDRIVVHNAIEEVADRAVDHAIEFPKHPPGLLDLGGLAVSPGYSQE